jgi:hypothetical protein
MKIGIVMMPEETASMDLYLMAASVYTDPAKHHMVRMVTIDEKRDIDVLLIPDFSGYNLTTQAFSGMRFPPLNYPGAPQFPEKFRVEMLQYWMDKKDTAIVAFGNAAIMCHDIVGGKAEVIGSFIEPMATPKIPTTITTEGKDGPWKIQGTKFLGLRDTPRTPDQLFSVIHNYWKEFKGLDQNDQGDDKVPVFVPVP